MREKGSNTINRSSILRGDSICVSVGQKVHVTCRRDYCNPHVITKDLTKDTEKPTTSRTMRSEGSGFCFQEHCLFCAQSVFQPGKKRAYDDSQVFPVRTDDFQQTVEQICKERNDRWALDILSRIEYARDLHAADAVYH